MTPDRPVTVFVSIGNVGSALTYADWSAFHEAIAAKMDQAGAVFQDWWFSPPTANWQTACWCVDVQPGIVDRLKGELGAIGAKYGTRMVAWNEVASAVILG